MWILGVHHQYLDSGVDLVSCSLYYPSSKFVKNESDMPSETFLCFTKEGKIYNPSPLLTNFLHIFWESPIFCPHILKIHIFFPQKVFIEPKSTNQLWPETNNRNKYYRSRSMYDHTRNSKVSHRKFKNHCSFSTRS